MAISPPFSKSKCLSQPKNYLLRLLSLVMDFFSKSPRLMRRSASLIRLYGPFKQDLHHLVLVVLINLITAELATPSYISKAARVCGLMKFPLSLFMAITKKGKCPDSLFISFRYLLDRQFDPEKLILIVSLKFCPEMMVSKNLASLYYWRYYSDRNRSAIFVTRLIVHSNLMIKII